MRAMKPTGIQLMLFSEASRDDPAKTCPSPDVKPASKGREAASGSRCCGLSKRFDPVTFLLKTCVERSISPSTLSRLVWKVRATKSGRASYLQASLARRTRDIESSSSASGATSPTLWPTCRRTSDWKGPASTERYLSKGRNPMTEMLSAAVQAYGERQMQTLAVEQTANRHIENARPRECR